MDKTERLKWQQYIKDRVTIDSDTGCWNWANSIDKEGYGQFRFKYPARYRDGYRAHRASYEVFMGPIPPGLLVRHVCHNRRCCNPSHLLPGTDLDNSNDKIDAGRDNNSGEQGSNAKLTATQVIEIRRLYAEGREGRSRRISMRQLAETYGVSTSCISNCINGWTWEHLK